MAWWQALDDLIGQLPENQAISALETPPLGSAVVSPNETPPRGNAVALPAEKPAPEKLPFQQLGHFQIVAQIGSGGMGDVYRGYEASLDRFVAIKVLAATLARDKAFVGRFQRRGDGRCQAVASQRGAHLFHRPRCWIPLLRHAIHRRAVAGAAAAREKRLPVDEVVAIIEQCLAGLAAAHAQGLIHRDVKPGNILLERTSGRAILVDFGLARHVNANTRMTATGVVMGTVDYVAPEQARGQEVDGRADIYSLGIMFYELLAGRLPFISDSPTAMLFQHAYEEPFPLKQAVPDVPQPLVDIIAHMMAKEPAERYPSCAAVSADLQAFRRGELPAPFGRDVGGEGSDGKLPSPFGRGAGGEGGDHEDVALPAALSALPRDNPLQRARDWAATIFRRYAPEYIQEMQGTTQQMDGAVAHYQRRRNELATLLKEAREIETELSEQIEARSAAAAAAACAAEASATEDDRQAAQAKQREHEESLAALRPQHALQRQQVEDLERQLNKADATLASLRSQQNVLKARLQAAEARRQMEGGLPQPKRRRWLVPMAVGTAVLALMVLLFILRRANEPPAEIREWIGAMNAQQRFRTVTEGVGWGGFRFGASRDELIKTLGPPDANPDPRDRHARWSSQYHVDCLIDAVRGAFEIRFNPGFDLPLASGIRIGSSESEVMSAYGVPNRVVQQPPAKMLEYDGRDVLVWINGGKVVSFTVFRPSMQHDGGAFARDAKLDDAQRKYRNWTEDYFKGLLNPQGLQNLAPHDKAVVEETMLKQLSSSDSHARIAAINTLAVLGSKQAVPGILHIAAERRHKDNRDRWMAIRPWECSATQASCRNSSILPITTTRTHGSGPRSPWCDSPEKTSAITWPPGGFGGNSGAEPRLSPKNASIGWHPATLAAANRSQDRRSHQDSCFRRTARTVAWKALKTPCLTRRSASP